MLTRRSILFPLVEALLLTNTPDSSLALLLFICISGRHTIFSLKYNLIRLLDAFYLYSELAGI
jgi:hypothetical protein